MNRIILVGNGFDLAHGLPTSYKDYIVDYWNKWPFQLGECIEDTLTDGLCTLKIKPTKITKLIGDSWKSIITNIRLSRSSSGVSVSEIIKSIKVDKENFVIERTPFFEAIDTSLETKNWVDIENEYYLLLKSIFKNVKSKYVGPEELDAEMRIIRTKLIEYLCTIQNEKINKSIIKEDIEKSIFEPVCLNDIAIENRKDFLQFIENRWNDRHLSGRDKITFRCSKYGYSMYNLMPDLAFYEKDTPDIVRHKNNVLSRKEIPVYYLLPDNVMILNFNYTRTPELYIPEKSDVKVNYIHGSLNEPEKIIFGYGDELDEDYKAISNLNDNNYLTNIKSIRYLETDNYRRLLAFIDSSPFQIYIMGHSCGNSDRTLLNTLFEHRNCVTIKPYYHLKDNGSDNYIEIVQNISRNFSNMQLMRDRVVNKSYCKQL